MANRKQGLFPRKYYYHEEGPEAFDISSSEEDEWINGSKYKKFIMTQKGQCYWKHKFQKFSHKLYEMIILNNKTLENLNKDCCDINEIMDEMKDEIDSMKESEDDVYDELQNDTKKLTMTFNKLRKELMNINNY